VVHGLGTGRNRCNGIRKREFRTVLTGLGNEGQMLKTRSKGDGVEAPGVALSRCASIVRREERCGQKERDQGRWGRSIAKQFEVAMQESKRRTSERRVSFGVTRPP